MIGSTLAHYAITHHLGSGGMGDVYQATDSKLGRSVAIKFLPEAFSHDPDRVARFQREARVLASLNHPNIAAIYGLEEVGGRNFLVMELVPGETLAGRIAQGAIPVAEALGIATGIAEALEAAHESGVVHRDLKPANVKITPDGKVKVLDFGLAKALGPAEAGHGPAKAGHHESAGGEADRVGHQANMAALPTMTSPAVMTGVGVILGTAAYMSPEQAKGREADRRSDVFAFGCVLYEMLAGRRAFDGDGVVEILGRIVTAAPDWNRLPPSVSPRIRELLRLCLEKDPKKRRQTATDVRIDIEQALAQPVTTPVERPARRGRVGWIAAAAAVLVAAGLSAPAWRHLNEPPPPPEMRVEISTPATTDLMSFALSPDGRQIVFVASGDGPSRLWLRPLAASAAQPLPGTDGASFPFWSPDSRSVAFFADGKLKRIDIGGGQPQTITDAIPRGGTWNEAGVILFARSAVGPLLRVSASGGNPSEVTTLKGHSSHRFPQFLPGGRQFLFYAQGSAETGGIHLGSLDSAETRRLAAAGTAGLYMPPGWLLWARGDTLIAQRLDPTQGELSGDPVTVAESVGIDTTFNVSAVSVAATGLVAYRSGGAGRRQLIWVDRAGRTMSTMGAADENGQSSPRISPDGRQVAVFRQVQGNPDIWLLDGSRASRLTTDAGPDRWPNWSSDGGWIVFDSIRKGSPRSLYVKQSGGAGTEAPLLDTAAREWNVIATDWSADGRFLLFQNADPKTEWDLWVLPLDAARPMAGAKPWPFLATSFTERYGQFSPNGRWVAYMSNESGPMEVYVRAFVEPAASGAKTVAAGGRFQVSTNGGIYPRWRPDGRELFYIAPDGNMMAVPMTITDGKVEPGTPVALFRARIYGGATETAQGRQYDVARDGRFLINTIVDDAAVFPITLLQNWKGQ